MKLIKYNPFDYIEDDKEIILFLNELLHDEDSQVFVLAINSLVRKKGITEVSKMTGINFEDFYKVFNE